MVAHWLELLGKLPTTQSRVAMTLLAILATTVRYVSSHAHVASTGAVLPAWEPSYEWLGFLLLLAGVDTAHFIGKRLTDAEYQATKLGRPSGAMPQPPEAK